MNKLVTRFKNLDQTKKLVIALVTLSFFIIISVTLYNGLTGNFEQDTVVETQPQKTNETIETEEDKSKESEESDVIEEDVEANENATVSQNQSDTNTSSSQNQQPNTSSSAQSTSPATPPQSEVIAETKKITVSITVNGMGSVMMEGQIEIDEGATAYSALVSLAKQRGTVVSGSSSYVTGIGDLKEKEHGLGSGWTYRVNGVMVSRPAGGCILKQGDTVVWSYVNYQ